MRLCASTEHWQRECPLMDQIVKKTGGNPPPPPQAQVNVQAPPTVYYYPAPQQAPAYGYTTADGYACMNMNPANQTFHGSIQTNWCHDEIDFSEEPRKKTKCSTKSSSFSGILKWIFALVLFSCFAGVGAKASGNRVLPNEIPKKLPLPKFQREPGMAGYLHPLNAPVHLGLGAAAVPEGLAVIKEGVAHVSFVLHIGVPLWQPSEARHTVFSNFCNGAHWTSCPPTDPNVHSDRCLGGPEIEQVYAHYVQSLKYRYRTLIDANFYSELMLDICQRHKGLCTLDMTLQAETNLFWISSPKVSTATKDFLECLDLFLDLEVWASEL